LNNKNSESTYVAEQKEMPKIESFTKTAEFED